MGWKGLASGAWIYKKKLYSREHMFFVIEKYVEDVNQDEKHIQDLLEAVMRPTFFVKEEFRRSLSNMT